MRRHSIGYAEPDFPHYRAGRPGDAGVAHRDCQDRRQEVYGRVFATGSLLRSKTAPSAIVQADRKTFTEYGHKISISQIEEIGMYGLKEVQEDLLEELRKLEKEEDLKLACLLVTDIVTHDSMLLAVGDEEVLEHIEYERLDPNLFAAKDVVSRKKQLFPAISRALKVL